MAKIEVQRTHVIEDPTIKIEVNLADGKVRAVYYHLCQDCAGYGCRGGCKNTSDLSDIKDLRAHVGDVPFETLRQVMKEKLGL